MHIDDILLIKFKKEWDQGLIELAHDGTDVYVRKWEVPNIEMPTVDTFLEWAKECDLPHRQMIAVKQRVYPPLEAQLDMLYHDTMEGTTTWKDTIAAVKAAHPKPKV